MTNNQKEGHHKLVFKPRDWIQLLLRKQSFLMQVQFELVTRKDGPFKIIKNIRENVYMLEVT